ncbi:hypothetical protein MMC22_003430 [Lobaria immixta]|nr:hypothetical protein [Lobaria immixta]
MYPLTIFTGSKDGKEDSNKFIEDVESHIVRVMPDIGVEPVDTRDGAARRARLFATSSDGASQLYLREQRLDLLSFSSSYEYPTVAKVRLVIRVQFRAHLREKALEWYCDLPADIRSNWHELKTRFVAEYKLIPRHNTNPNRYFNLVYNLKQRGRSIVAYVEEAEKLQKACPANLLSFLPHQFIAGLDDESKIGEV